MNTSDTRARPTADTAPADTAPAEILPNMPAPTRIDEALIGELAQLARLGLSTQERQTLSQDLHRVLEHFESLALLSEAEILPMFQPTHDDTPLRSDLPRAGMGQAQATAQSPESDGVYFVVPRVLK